MVCEEEKTVDWQGAKVGQLSLQIDRFFALGMTKNSRPLVLQ